MSVGIYFSGLYVKIYKIKSGLGQRGGTYVLKIRGVQAKHMNPPKSATDVFKVISEQLNMFTGDS